MENPLLPRLKITFGRRLVACIPLLPPFLSLRLQRLSTWSIRASRTTAAVACHVCCVDALVVLDSVLLDAFPHLLDAEVELVLRLLFLVDEIMRVVR